MAVPPRKRPAPAQQQSKTTADPKVEEAVKKLMDRYPHLHPGVEGEDEELSDERFADAARDLFKKRLSESKGK